MGERYIKVNENVKPIVHSARKVQFALKGKLDDELKCQKAGGY